MERTTTIEGASEILGRNFIGPEQLKPFFKILKKKINFSQLPEIGFTTAELQGYRNDYILILGVPFAVDGWFINIKNLRSFFGIEQKTNDPCFYNQDWYMKQDFISETLMFKWYLVKKEVVEASRSIMPDVLLDTATINKFPQAILCTYVFFAWYYHTAGELLWENDFVWCSDKDHNGDRIYVGKYKDVDSFNKNGFSIHRHLALRNCYASIDVV